MYVSWYYYFDSIRDGEFNQLPGEIVVYNGFHAFVSLKAFVT